MAVRKLSDFITPEEYLRWEKDAEHKSEYDNGVIVAMAGAKNDHISISVDLSLSVGFQIRKTNCLLRNSDQRVRVEECNRYFYPDLIVVCGEMHFETREGLEQLTNPTVVFEILSDSTEDRDRTIKLHCYRTLPSLLHYVLVSQTMPFITVYSRVNGNEWKLRTAWGRDQSLTLEGVGITLYLSEIYEHIPFSEENP